jgi:hypothetical protein
MMHLVAAALAANRALMGRPAITDATYQRLAKNH